MADRTALILENIRSALLAMTDPDSAPPGASVFKVAGVFDSSESFMDNPGAPNLNSRAAGIVSGEVVRGRGMGSGDAYAERMPVEILYAFPVKRAAGADEKAATLEMLRLCNLIRAALLTDASRGGNCGLSEFDGRWVNGTDADGVARLVDRTNDQAVYTAALPVVVGWTVYEPE